MTEKEKQYRKDRAFKKNMIHKSSVRSICEVLREIYWHTEDPDIRDKAIEASRMAKKMARKLIEYNYDINSGLDYEELSPEVREEISSARWAKYKEELERGIDHPMNGSKKDEE